MSFNLNNYYPKPSIYRGSPVADQNLYISIGFYEFLDFAPTTTMVMFDIQNGDVLCTVDGSAPNPTAPINGHFLKAGTMYTWSAEMAKRARFCGIDIPPTIHLSELQM